MPDFPAPKNIDRVVISSAMRGGLGDAWNGMGFTAGAAAWPTANKAIYIPFGVHAPITVVKMFVENGTTSGSIDVGIYDRGGARIVSSGATAQTGGTATQEFNITDTALNPGLYYLAIAMNNNTGQLQRWGASSTIPRAMGVMEQASAFVLPATATFALLSSSYVPFVAATLRTAI